LVGAGAAEEDMVALLHHRAGEAHRILRPGDACHCAGRARSTVHDRRVELVGPVISEDRALAGVEIGVVLEHAGRRFDCIERGAALGEDRRSGGKRAIERGAYLLVFFR
jgi:hypothetical protein